MAIALVQSTTSSTLAANPNTLLLTLGSATTSGNVVIVAIISSVVELKVTSSHGIFSDVTPQGANTAGGQHTVSIFMGIMSGADTAITINSRTATRMAAVAVEYSGSHIIYSDIPSNSQGSTNVPTTGALTNATATCLYVGALGQKGMNIATPNTNWCSTPSSPFAIQGQNTSNVNSASVDVAVVYLDAIVSTSSLRSATISSLLGTFQSSGVLATFKEIVTGGGIRTAGHGGLAA